MGKAKNFLTSMAGLNKKGKDSKKDADTAEKREKHQTTANGNKEKAEERNKTSSANGCESAEEVELRQVFERFDANGDGRISEMELASMMQALGRGVTEDEIRIMMTEADSDRDGFIDLDEFIRLNSGKGGGKGKGVADDDDLRSAFEVFDLNRDGSISADELCRVLRSMGHASTTRHECQNIINGVVVVDGNNGSSTEGAGVGAAASLKYKDFRTMMTNANTNGNGAGAALCSPDSSSAANLRN